MTCSLDFVDSIAASPTIRLALATGPMWIINADETDFSPPPIREAVAQTLLTDGGVVPSAAYDFRRIRLGLFLSDDTPDDTAAALQALYRELDRPGGNILRWHEHTTNPVFFRTFRTSASSVRHLGRDGRRKRIAVDLRAEPFGYGLEEDLGTVTVNNDPAAGTNPTLFDVSGVKGDVEAPTRIRRDVIAGGGGGSAPGTRILFAMRRRGTPANVPYLLQAESMTQGTDTSVQNDVGMSGGQYSQCTFSTVTSMDARLVLGEHPSTPTVDARGTYRLFGRMQAASTGVFRVQARIGGHTDPAQGPAVVDLPEITIDESATVDKIYDLGLMQIPVGVTAKNNGPSGDELAAEGARIELWAARDSGSGNLDFDYFLLVPADERLALTDETAEWTTSADSGVVYDSFADLMYIHRSTDDAIVNNGIGALLGSLPMLQPGVTNRIYFVDNLYPNNNSIATSEDLEVSYWPRYLSIRPAST